MFDTKQPHTECFEAAQQLLQTHTTTCTGWHETLTHVHSLQQAVGQVKISSIYLGHKIPVPICFLLARSAVAMGTLRRLSGSPLPAHSQSAAPGMRPGPHRTVSLRIQVSNAHHHATSCVRLHRTHHTLWLARLGLLEATRPKNIYNNTPKACICM